MDWMSKLSPDGWRKLCALLAGPEGQRARSFTDHPKFGVWMMLVDAHVGQRIGMSVFDLGDKTYRDWFDDGMFPSDAAELAIEDEATEMGFAGILD